MTCCAQLGSSGGQGRSSGCAKLSVPPTTAQLTFLCTTYAHQFLQTYWVLVAVQHKPQMHEVGLEKSGNLLVSLTRSGGRMGFSLKHAVMERCSTDERKRYGKAEELQSGLHGYCSCRCSVRSEIMETSAACEVGSAAAARRASTGSFSSVLGCDV